MDHGPINTRFDGYYLLPVLCSSEMVRAHLDGMKFETRRPDTTAQYARAQDALRRGRKVFGWVREGWYATYEAERRAGPVRGYFDLTKEQRRVRAVRSCWYQADEELKSCEDRFTPEKRWVPGMHMPFRHHRLFMRIRSIECCQLGDVTEADALREGIAIVLGRASFGFAGNIYGANFFMATGFHGFHVLVGTIFLTICLIRTMKGHFTPERHVGFEAAAWYWHFVDVVWLFLFFAVYIWASQGATIAH